MALTRAQEIALFTILEVPYSASHKQLSGDGLTVLDKTVSSAIAAKNAILDYLTNSIYTDADLTTELTTQLIAWSALGTDMSTMEGGSVGPISGINDDPAKNRAEIARRILIIVPFYRCHLQFQASGNVNIPIVR